LSIFPGIDRVLSVLEGELVLTFDGEAALKLTAESEPAAFPGDIAVRAETPSATVTDLNVMTRRGHAHARVNRPRTGASNAVIAGETTLILSLSPGVRIWHAGAPYDLDRHDGLLVEAARGEPICLDAASPPGIFQVDFTRSAEIHRVDAKPLLTRIP
jgi:environmental stress-induced protein Ves